MPQLYSKTIVSSPHATSWSQAYTAGNLFGVVSLTQKDTLAETDTLGHIGKEILNTLEAEYFTIETKDLESIQNAVNVAIKHAFAKESIMISACFAAVIENALYVFCTGGAKIYLKRKGTLGLLLFHPESNLIGASGFLQTNDLVILQTKNFGEAIPKEKLEQAAKHTHPDEIAESLSPLVQGHETGGAAAVVFLYAKNPNNKEEITEETIIASTPSPREKLDFGKIIQALFRLTATYRAQAPKLPHIVLTRKRKLFLSIGILLTILLFFGVIYTSRQKEAAKQQALFEQIYATAQKKFDEGQGLAGLNKNLSRDDFAEGQKLIMDNKDKFSNKVHKEKLDTLLKNIEEGLLAVSGVNRIDAKETKIDASLLLSFAREQNPMAISQDEKTVYTIDDKAILNFDKKTKAKKTLITNKDSWKTVGGLGAYNGNIYVLDKDAGQIYKFVGSNQSNYLTTKQDLSKAISIAIDGSIWILYSDGTIQKWTRGKQDSFTVSGLNGELKNPTRIFTDTESAKLYILDNGNGRIVVLMKNGVYETQYQAEVLKTATEFDVLEKDKKIFVLNGKKVWEINLSSN